MLYNWDKQAEISHLLDVFLKTPVYSDRGQPAPVADHDLLALSDLVEAIAEAKWQRDRAGNLPIDFLVIDREKMAAYVEDLRALQDANRRPKRGR